MGIQNCCKKQEIDQLEYFFSFLRFFSPLVCVRVYTSAIYWFLQIALRKHPNYHHHHHHLSSSCQCIREQYRSSSMDICIFDL